MRRRAGGSHSRRFVPFCSCFVDALLRASVLVVVVEALALTVEMVMVVMVGCAAPAIYMPCAPSVRLYFTPASFPRQPARRPPAAALPTLTARLSIYGV